MSIYNLIQYLRLVLVNIPSMCVELTQFSILVYSLTLQI